MIARLTLRWKLVIATGILIIAIAIWEFRQNPRVHIIGFRNDQSIGAVGIIPMGDAEVQNMQKMIADARKDKDASRPLLNTLRKRFPEAGINATRAGSGDFYGRCPKGSALVYSLDNEGYAYFLFVVVTGNSVVTLDRPDNGIDLLRDN